MTSNRIRLVSVMGAGVALVAVGLAPAATQQSARTSELPGVRISPGAGLTTQLVTITGTGFRPGQVVYAHIHPVNGRWVVNRPLERASASGSFSIRTKLFRGNLWRDANIAKWEVEFDHSRPPSERARPQAWQRFEVRPAAPTIGLREKFILHKRGWQSVTGDGDYGER